MTRQDAVLSKELGEGEGEGAPWSFEVVIEPGLFVRGYYFDDGDRTIRAMFASLFTLSDGDVSTMAETIGSFDVAAIAAWVPGVFTATITSGAVATMSAASFGNRSSWFSLEWTSILKVASSR